MNAPAPGRPSLTSRGRASVAIELGAVCAALGLSPLVEGQVRPDESPPTAPAVEPDTAQPAEAPIVARIARAAELVQLVESYQPSDPFLRNRWSEVVRSAFIYAGAQKVFAAESAVVQAWTGCGVEGHGRNPDDFVLSSIGWSLDGPTTTPDPSLAAEAARFLALIESQSLLIHLDQIADEPCRLLAPPAHDGMNAPLASQETYELGALKNFATAAMARMCFSAQTRGSPHTAAHFAGGMELGRVACGRPMMLALISGQGIQNRLMLAALRLTRSDKLDADQCDHLLEEVRRRRLPQPGIFLEMERIIARDSIDRYFSRRGLEVARMTAEQESAINELTQAEAEAIIDRAWADAAASLDARLADPAGASDQEGQGDRGGWVSIPEGRGDPDGLLRVLTPPVRQLLLAEREHRCIRAGLVAGLLLAKHRLARGEYPAMATDLLPEFAELWPPDPMAPESGLRYRRAGDDYVLYSIGADGVDDQGTPAAQRPANALTGDPRWAGSDYVIAR